MEKDGEHPDEVFESPPDESQGWYFDLPQGAWERQEEKNRNLRQALLNKQQPVSRRDPKDEDGKPAHKKRRWFGGKDDDAEAGSEAEGARITRLSEEPREERRARLEAMKSEQATENWSTEPEAEAPPADRALLRRSSEPREPMPEADSEPTSRWDAIFGAGLEEGSIVDGLRQWATGDESDLPADDRGEATAAGAHEATAAAADEEAASEDTENDEWDDLLAASEGGSILEALRDRRARLAGDEGEAGEAASTDESRTPADWTAGEAAEEHALNPGAAQEEPTSATVEAEFPDEPSFEDDEDIWATDDEEIARILQGTSPGTPDGSPEAVALQADDPDGEWKPVSPSAFMSADEDGDSDDADTVDEEPSNLLAWRASKKPAGEATAALDEDADEQRDDPVFKEAMSAGIELDALDAEHDEPAPKLGLLKRIFGRGGDGGPEPAAEVTPDEVEGEWMPAEPAAIQPEPFAGETAGSSATAEAADPVAEVPPDLPDDDEPAWDGAGEWAPVEAEEPRPPGQPDRPWTATLGSAANETEAWSRPGSVEDLPAAKADSAYTEEDEEDPWAPFERADAGHEHTEPGTAALALNDEDEGDAWEPVAFEEPTMADTTGAERDTADADDGWAHARPDEPEQELPLEAAAFQSASVEDDVPVAPTAAVTVESSQPYTEDDWSAAPVTEDDAPFDPMEAWGWDPETATALGASAVSAIDAPVAEDSPMAPTDETTLGLPAPEVDLDASDAVAELMHQRAEADMAEVEPLTVPWALAGGDHDTAWDERPGVAWPDRPENAPGPASPAAVNNEFVELDASDMVSELTDDEATEVDPARSFAMTTFDDDADDEVEDWAEMLGGDESDALAPSAWSFAPVADAHGDAANPLDEEAESPGLESPPGSTMPEMDIKGGDEGEDSSEPGPVLPWQDASHEEPAAYGSNEPASEDESASPVTRTIWGQPEAGEGPEDDDFDLAAFVPGEEDAGTPDNASHVDAWGRPLDVPVSPAAASDHDTPDETAAREDDDAWSAVVAASGYDAEDEAEPPTFGKVSSTARHDRAGSWLADNFPEQAPAPDPVEAAFAEEDASTSDEHDVVLRAFEAHAASDLDDESKEASEPARPDDFKELFGEDAPGIVEDFIEPHEPPSFAKMRLSPQHQSDVGFRDQDDDWAPGNDDSSVAAAALDAPFLAGSIKSSSAEGAKQTRTWVRELVETGLLALLVFLSVRASFQNFKVDGTSMSPTLADGQFLIVNKLVYSEVDVDKLSKVVPFVSAGDDPTRHVFHGPERGDIVVLRDPTSPDIDLIKRVIGLPGEKIEILGGVVYINDQRLIEPYIESVWSDDYPARVIPEDSYFVMGDNRDNSKDSRSPTIGFIAEELIIGRAEFSYLPFDAFGLIGNGGGSLSEEDGRPRLTSELRPPTYANQLVGD